MLSPGCVPSQPLDNVIPPISLPIQLWFWEPPGPLFSNDSRHQRASKLSKLQARCWDPCIYKAWNRRQWGGLWHQEAAVRTLSVYWKDWFPCILCSTVTVYSLHCTKPTHWGWLHHQIAAGIRGRWLPKRTLVTLGWNHSVVTGLFAWGESPPQPSWLLGHLHAVFSRPVQLHDFLSHLPCHPLPLFSSAICFHSPWFGLVLL